MVKYRKIRTFADLYAYFKKDNKHFFFKKISGSQPIIEVGRIDEHDKQVIITDPHPVNHERLAKYIFKGIEVSRPELTIDENTMKALVNTLSLDPDIFEYPPDMEH